MIKFRVKVIASVLVLKFFNVWQRIAKIFGISIEHWDITSWYEPGGFKRYWESLEPVQRYQKRLMTGDENKDHVTFSIEFLKEKFIARDKLTGLSIGCAESLRPEMKFCETGLFSSFEVIDIAGKLIERQRCEAQKRGLDFIKYTVANLNYIKLSESVYDLIWGHGTIHHIENLENFFQQVCLGLKKDGLFIMREYIGPDRLQYTDTQIAIANEWLSSIPPRYKRKWSGLVKKEAERISLRQLLKSDPSEAARSSEIMSILEKHLEIIHLAKTGGTVLNPLLDGIASSFENSEEGTKILNKLIEEEEKSIQKNEIPSDYVFCIARKRS
jgi:SAM-dependent methyltransferase